MARGAPRFLPLCPRGWGAAGGMGFLSYQAPQLAPGLCSELSPVPGSGGRAWVQQPEERESLSPARSRTPPHILVPAQGRCGVWGGQCSALGHGP